MEREGLIDQLGLIRILHVDDEVSQSEFLRYFLPETNQDFIIDSVSDPTKALECIKETVYDCIISDFQMPKLNGIELAAMIRKKSDIPIILYTGQGSEEVAEAAFSVGIDDYLRKEMDPSHFQVLAKRIRQIVEKKRTDRLYRTVIEQTRDALSILVEKRVVFANQAMLNLLGLKDISEFGDKPFNFAVGDDRERGLERFDEVVRRDGDPGYHKYKLKKKTGEIIYVDVSTSPVTYNGKTGVLCLVRDISERERLEAEKRESQERLRSLVELAPDGIVTFDLRGVVTSVNSAFSHITGYDREEIIGKNFLRLKTLPRTEIKNYFMVFSKVLRGNIPPPFEFRYSTKKGKINWGEAHVGKINISGKTEFMAILRDISDRKLTAETDGLNISEEIKMDNNSVNDDLLISLGQLAYLIGNEIIEPISDVRKKISELSENQSEIDTVLPSIENSLDQALLFLEGFITRTDESLLIASEQDIMQIISDTVNKLEIPENSEITTRHVGEITAHINRTRLEEILSTLLARTIYIAEKNKQFEIISETTKKYVRVKIRTVSSDSNNLYDYNIVEKLVSDSEIIICNEEIQDLGGKLLFDSEENNNLTICLTLPTHTERKTDNELIEIDELSQIVQQN
ncbi:MAG: PAS domain S-box protein [Candidatus Bathyarchaeota archaeon]|nr:PAS domain S-box protein [Candidatus Bathyarchaeota archaeon]